MPVNLSIKNAPDDLVERLKGRARRNHRSLQGELLSIIEQAVDAERRVSLRDAYEEGRRRGLSTPAESVEIIRSDRDGR